MCGIYGTTIQYNAEQVKKKLKRTDFRGPDKSGHLFIPENDGGSVILGHNRLSIIDLDPRSDQPFTYQGHIHIVFNGEIYNFKKIKDTLTKKGYVFKTTSDTEVICAAYLEYGKDCLEQFSGMFSFVIFDENKQQFFGARDRLGKKPFYYCHNGKDFEFSSQVSSIQMFRGDLTVSEKAIAHYLTWGAVPEPMSIFNEVQKLLPGHYFTFDLNTGAFSSHCYWDIDYLGEKPYQGSYEEAKSELNTILEDTVSSRLFADVPVGVFLSGGVDSSLIAAIASKVSSKKVKTFSVKFNEEGYDESPFAQQVANHLQTDHHVIECNYTEGIDLIENFSHYYDEPFSDPSSIPTMLLAKHTRKEVTVALSGDGGDEHFIGYDRYDWAHRIQKLYNLPYGFRALSSKIIGISPKYKHKVIAKALRIKDVNEAYVSTLNSVDQSWIRSDYNCNDVYTMKYLQNKKKNVLERISDFDIKTYLNWTINTKVDRATMAYSLEARGPLMDHRVVDFARSLPTSYKYYKRNQKRILKDVLYEYVPKHIFDRPKAGFSMPFYVWFREDLKDFVLSELSDENLKSIPCIDVDQVKFRIKQHMDGVWDRHPLIWRLLVLKQWLSTNGKEYPVR